MASARAHPGTAMLSALVTISLVYVSVWQYLQFYGLTKDSTEALEKLRQRPTNVLPGTSRRAFPYRAGVWSTRSRARAGVSGPWRIRPEVAQAASAGEDTRIYLWDLAAGRLLGNLPGHADTVLGLAFSPDGSRLASAGSDSVVKVWDIAAGKEEQTLTAHTKAVHAVAFQPRGHLLASASGDRTVVLWNTTSWQVVRTLRGHERGVNAVAFSPDGSILAIAGDDGTVKVWDVADGTLRHTLSGHKDRVTGVCFDADGGLLSVGWDQKALVWDVAAGKLSDRCCRTFRSRVGSTPSPGRGTTASASPPAGRTGSSYRVRTVSTGIPIRSPPWPSVPTASTSSRPAGTRPSRSGNSHPLAAGTALLDCRASRCGTPQAGSPKRAR